jgi:hypothetical protein
MVPALPFATLLLATMPAAPAPATAPPPMAPAPATASAPAPPSAAGAAPSAPGAKVRVAIPDFQIEGSASPALALQLQDGFVLGLVRAGVQVVDPVDTARRLDGKPELGHCDSSACLKSIGQMMDVKYVVRVKVEVAGNSYKVVGRIFSTEGPAPAALPIANRSKSCDVCTVAEARDVMMRLADALKVYLEEPAAPVAPSLLVAAPSGTPRLAGPVMTAMLGAVAIAVGTAVLATMGSCFGTKCSENRVRTAVGGGLIGAGAVMTVMGAYVTVERSRGAGVATTSVSLALSF